MAEAEAGQEAAARDTSGISRHCEDIAVVMRPNETWPGRVILSGTVSE